MRARPSSWSSSLEMLRAGLAALPWLLLLSLSQAGCADLWGFDDLTLGEAGAKSDAGPTGGPEAGTSPDATMGDDAGPDGEAVTTCPDGTLNDTLNCGGCGNVCDNTKSLGATCEPSDAGVWTCHYTACAAGLEDCDQSGANTNGCETSMTSTSSCGSCGIVCDATHSGPATCVMGPGGSPLCQYAGCMAGFADCITMAPDTDGCETSITTASDCGACGVACDSKHSQGASCKDGKTCQYTGCSAGFADCNIANGDVDGCELATSGPASCNACGAACDTTHSNGAMCDTSNGATCKYSGPSGPCQAGYADCNTSPPDTNGCETPITSATNCGACGVTCDTTNSTGAGCSGTSCTYGPCKAGFADCFPAAPNTNGCESSLGATTSCGACGHACSTTTGPAKCDGTTCSYTCNAGSSDCNAATAPDTDGCECATPACCPGAKCQTVHANGKGAPYYDCNADKTYNVTTATEACEASAGAGHCAASTKCCGLLNALSLCVGSTADSVCGTANGTCFCWQYGTADLPGTVQTESPTKCSASCPSSSDPTWN